MQVHNHIDHLPPIENAVITIGTFDGVHKGHQQIIRQLKEEAKKIQGETVIITFHPHPRSIVPGREPVSILTTPNEKIALLENMGIDHLVIIPFNLEFSQQSATAFIEHFLVEKFHPHTVIIGYDHRFGKGREGDYHLMEKLGKKFGFLVKEIPEQVLNDITVSSTRIRKALNEGEIETANNYLGHTYSFEGEVVDGKKIGRTIGYPTANIKVYELEKLIPANGVYAVEVRCNSESNLHKGMMSIGTRPTIGGTPRTIEVHLFDFTKNIYHSTIRVFVKYFLRKEVKFAGLEEMKLQLYRDQLQACSFLQKDLSNT
ncbi:MAG: bifunctional riboflavin kinase/FAD synthetase [Bacteroidetes bacterium]|nr:bifunctional riboflavin kinase/FAD synthetase [Bacteroidota bacterium]